MNIYTKSVVVGGVIRLVNGVGNNNLRWIMVDIKIFRNKGWFGRFRTAIIMADDVEIGRVKSGESVDVRIPEQTSHIYVKMDWGRSSPYPVNKIKHGQTIYMNAYFTLNPLRSIGVIPIPITLEDDPRWPLVHGVASVFYHKKQESPDNNALIGVLFDVAFGIQKPHHSINTAVKRLQKQS